MKPSHLRLILCDLRGSGNVGSILRTADACGVEWVYACGYTPYPRIPGDARPPHIISSNTKQIAKTALGAEHTINISHHADAHSAFTEARQAGFDIILIEQAENSLNLFSFQPPSPKIALVVGNEVTGLPTEILTSGYPILELPMLGDKESLGVSVAAGIALYQLRFGGSSDGLSG